MCTDILNSVGSLFSGSGGLSENSPAGTSTGGVSGIGKMLSDTSAGKWLSIGAFGLQGGSQLAAGFSNASALGADAATEREAAARQAALILKSAERTRGAARAATAASGAKVDEFSLANEQEIIQAGDVDASMAVLSGERRARALEQQAKQSKQGGALSALTSVFNIGSTFMGGWK